MKITSGSNYTSFNPFVQMIQTVWNWPNPMYCIHLINQLIFLISANQWGGSIIYVFPEFFCFYQHCVLCSHRGGSTVKAGQGAFTKLCSFIGDVVGSSRPKNGNFFSLVRRHVNLQSNTKVRCRWRGRENKS